METQKYTRKQNDSFGVALKYYSVLCSLNNITIGEKELLITAYIAIGEYDRKQLMSVHNISSAGMSNILGRLIKKQLITKELEINPYARADFQQGVKLEIVLENGKEG